MGRPPKKTKPRLRISPAQWRRVATELGFSTQQAKLVRLMLQGRRDKQIAEALQLGVPTVRTYLSRLFHRTGAHDRVDLLLKVFAFLLDDCRRNGRHHK